MAVRNLGPTGIACLIQLISLVFFVPLTIRAPEARPYRSGYVAEDLAALLGNRFEALLGDRKGQYSIRINDQWRICFEWADRSPGPSNVEIVDYH